MPCRAVTSRLLPPLLDLITTTNTAASPSASPNLRAVASALQALHRLLRCVGQGTRAVDSTQLGVLHPLHGLDTRALSVLLDIVQTTDNTTNTDTAITTTAGVASARQSRQAARPTTRCFRPKRLRSKARWGLQPGPLRAATR